MTAIAERQMATYLRLNFAEKVVFHNGQGQRRTILALVDRNPAVDAMSSVAPGFVVTVMNDELLGVSPKNIDVGVSTFEIHERWGKGLEVRNIQQIVDHDDTWVTLSVL